MSTFSKCWAGVVLNINLYFACRNYLMTSGNEAKEGKLGGGSGTMRIYNVADHYEILDKVGRGTYGTVYKAKGLKDGRFYAIKKL